MLRHLWQGLTHAMSSWHQGKLFIENAVAISHNSLHIFVGVLLWIALGLLLRRPLTSWLPWLWVFTLILWNETVDLWVEQWPDPGQQYGDGAKDVFLTMFVPTVVMVAARMRPDLFRGGARKRRR